MTKEEANQQLTGFFGRLGERGVRGFGEAPKIEARIGEAVVGFEFDKETGALSAQALIYRFRSEPKDTVLDAVFGEESEMNSGGGRLVFNSESKAFYLQRDFIEKVGENVFFDGINRLAVASLRWNTDILARAAGKS